MTKAGNNSAVFAVQLWMVASVFASVAGWSLSAIGQLNQIGYTLFFFIGAILLWFLRGNFVGEISRLPFGLGKLCRRFRRPLPLAFAALALLVFLGGVIYPPTNHTAFTYRIPRVLHWFAHGGWFWIHGPDCRINDRACGIEWMSAPLLLFMRSDRGIFLLNFIPWLLLPGLLFSVCTRLGVRPRAAWHWMWLLPAGYSFLLQAGSAGNDTFPAIYLLASVDFGLRAWKSRRASDVFYSILAAALLTGAKGSNLPLLLPCAILVFPLLPLLKRKLVATVLVLLIAAVVSFLPTAILNYVQCHDWTAANIEPANMTAKNPFVGLYGNAFQLALQNFAPPIFPQAGWWNQHAAEILPHGFVRSIENNFHTGFYALGEIPTEDWCGLGFGTSVLLASSLVASWWIGRSSKFHRTKSSGEISNPVPRMIRIGVLLSPWIGLLVYCAKSGMDTAARLISPYYVLLLPSLIYAGAQAVIVRQRWWRGACVLVFVLAFFVLAITPPRPLWPAQTILSRAVALRPNSHALNRALNVYSTYAKRSDPLAAVREELPKNLSVVGFLGTPDDIAISFWRPYGSRRVEQLLTSDTPEYIRGKGIEYAVISQLQLNQQHVALSNWLAQTHAESLSTTDIMVKVTDGPQPWHVVRFAK